MNIFSVNDSELSFDVEYVIENESEQTERNPSSDCSGIEYEVIEYLDCDDK